MARLLTGREAASALTEELKGRTASLARQGVTPKLVILRCGENEADGAYLRGALKRGALCGVEVEVRTLPDTASRQQLLDAISRGSAAAVSGLSQITRSHFLAALHAKSSRPSVFLVQDELAASRLQEELESFLGVQIPILPERELTFVEASGVSRQWEQKRLKLLYDLAAGKLPLLIASFGAMALRTMPRAVLFSASILLRVGASFTPEDLIERLTQAGYSRTTLVEGVGQFALRGGILDVYSPGEAMPVRCEFFGDELDAMVP